MNRPCPNTMALDFHWHCLRLVLRWENEIVIKTGLATTSHGTKHGKTEPVNFSGSQNHLSQMFVHFHIFHGWRKQTVTGFVRELRREFDMMSKECTTLLTLLPLHITTREDEISSFLALQSQGVACETSLAE